MSKFIKFFIPFFFACHLARAEGKTNSPQAKDVNSRENLKEFVESAAHVLSSVKDDQDKYEQVLNDFRRNDGVWRSDSVYLSIFDQSGNMFFHATRPNFEGKNIMNITDKNGVRIIEQGVQKALQGGGFAEYYFDNPATEGDEKNGSLKIGYATTFEGPGGNTLIVGSGFYPDPNHVDFFFIIDNARPSGDPCKKWINEKRTVALNSSSETKETHSRMLPDIKGELEENIPYQLSINSDATLPLPLSEPLSFIEEEKKYKEGFSGFLFFTPKESSGYYHVISSGRVWIDFIDEEKWIAIPATAYKPENCRAESIYKVVEFFLEKDKQYILYLFRSSDSLVRMMIQRKE